MSLNIIWQAERHVGVTFDLVILEDSDLLPQQILGTGLFMSQHST